MNLFITQVENEWVKYQIAQILMLRPALHLNI